MLKVESQKIKGNALFCFVELESYSKVYIFPIYIRSFGNVLDSCCSNTEYASILQSKVSILRNFVVHSKRVYVFILLFVVLFGIVEVSSTR